MHFEERNGRICLVEDREVLSQYDELAFCFDKSANFMIMHGERSRIEQHAKGLRETFSNAGLLKEAEDVTVVSSDKGISKPSTSLSTFPTTSVVGGKNKTSIKRRSVKPNMIRRHSVKLSLRTAC